jgi:hypothetical protein
MPHRNLRTRREHARHRNCLRVCIGSIGSEGRAQKEGDVKRREIKFVAGSLQLAPDRIEAGRSLRRQAAGPRKGLKAARAQPTRPARTSSRKRR